jgi:hypothetical protein
VQDYEMDSLNNLKKILAGKWDFVTMQAEEQVAKFFKYSYSEHIDKLTINLPIFYMAPNIMILMRTNPFRGSFFRRGGPCKSRLFLGPKNVY